jgi:uncharacterized protein (DUF849 family)
VETATHNAPFQSFKTSDGEIIITASGIPPTTSFAQPLQRGPDHRSPLQQHRAAQDHADELRRRSPVTILHTMTEMEGNPQQVNVPNDHQHLRHDLQ